MRPPIRLGLLGLGRIGSHHASIVRDRIDDLTLVKAHDPDLKSRTGVFTDVALVPTAEELIHAEDVDAVAICASTSSHVDLIVQAARAGKAIFCEKPVSHDLSELDRALAACATNAVLLHVGFNRRFDPGHRAVHNAVRAGDVGELSLVRITSRDSEPPSREYLGTSGGLFLDMSIHDFDMARFISGTPVVSVYAVGAARIDPSITEFADIDTAVMVLTHSDGVITTIDNSRRCTYGHDQRVEAFGALGAASSENIPLHGGALRTAGGTTTAALPAWFVDRYDRSYTEQWRAFAREVRGEVPPLTPTDQIRESLTVALAAKRSLREQRPVAPHEVDSLHEPHSSRT